MADTSHTGKDARGHFTVGNRIWELRTDPGRNPIFATADELRAACIAYFEWVDAQPLQEVQAFATRNGVETYTLPKMHAMTIRGMCLHIGVSHRRWNEWRTDRPDLRDVMEWAEDVIWQQKFAGAAAGLLNAGIVARELGLADKSELTGRDGGPIQTEDVTADADAFTRRLAGLAASAGAGTATGGTDTGTEGGA